MRNVYIVLSFIASPELVLGCHWLLVYVWGWWLGIWWVWKLILLMIALPVTGLLIRTPFRPVQDGNPNGSVVPIIASTMGTLVAAWLTFVGFSNSQGWLYICSAILLALSGLYTGAETYAAYSLVRRGE